MTNTDDTTGIAGLSRRSVLSIGAVGATAVALTACSQAKSAGPASTPPSGDASPGSSNSGSAGQPLAQLSAIKVGEAIAASGPDGSKIIISRPTATTVAAFSAICTHQGCVVAPAGKQLDCPCHGSVYDATTGAVLNGPAVRPLPPVSVTLSCDNVVAG
jgi:Rieske Fe-S protein